MLTPIGSLQDFARDGKMMKYPALSIALIIACGCASVAKQTPAQDEEGIKAVMSTYQEAINSKDVELLDTVLSRDFSVAGMPRNMSLKMLKSALYENTSPLQIKAFKNLVFVFEPDRSAGTVKCLKVISFGNKEGAIKEKLFFVRENGNWRLSKVPELGEVSVTTEVNNKIPNDSTSTTLNTAEMRKVSGNGYTVYFEDGMEDLAKKSLQILGEAKAMVLATLGFSELYSMDVMLTEKTNVTVKTNSGRGVIPILVKKGASIKDDQEFWKFLLWYHSHEETEMTLLSSYGLGKQETRWYRDGMADYAGYVVSRKLNPETCEAVTADRRERALRHKGKGSLLDWGGTGNMDAQPSEGGSGGQVAPARAHGLVVDEYGAALQFFLDFVKDYGEGMLGRINQELARTKEADGQKILEIMSTLTKEDIRQRVSKY
jgi:hypothetical protein